MCPLSYEADKSYIGSKNARCVKDAVTTERHLNLCYSIYNQTEPVHINLFLKYFKWIKERFYKPECFLFRSLPTVCLMLSTMAPRDFALPLLPLIVLFGCFVSDVDCKSVSKTYLQTCPTVKFSVYLSYYQNKAYYISRAMCCFFLHRQIIDSKVFLNNINVNFSKFKCNV